MGCVHYDPPPRSAGEARPTSSGHYELCPTHHNPASDSDAKVRGLFADGIGDTSQYRRARQYWKWSQAKKTHPPLVKTSRQQAVASLLRQAKSGM